MDTVTSDIARLAYLAGIVDGEGTITIGKMRSKDSRYKWYFSPLLSISTTTVTLVDWIQAEFPIFKKRYHSARPTQFTPRDPLPCYELRINRSEDLRRIIAHIVPYLIIKRRHANLILRFPRPHDEPWRRQKNGGRLYRTPEMYEKQCEIYCEIRQLHARRGPKASPL